MARLLELLVTEELETGKGLYRQDQAQLYLVAPTLCLTCRDRG